VRVASLDEVAIRLMGEVHVKERAKRPLWLAVLPVCVIVAVIVWVNHRGGCATPPGVVVLETDDGSGIDVLYRGKPINRPDGLVEGRSILDKPPGRVARGAGRGVAHRHRRLDPVRGRRDDLTMASDKATRKADVSRKKATKSAKSKPAVRPASALDRTVKTVLATGKAATVRIGKAGVAVVPVAEYEALRRLRDAAEDRRDAEEADRRLDEMEAKGLKPVPLERAVAELGLG
jgi:hypothetical protein